jgi:hypothetical protein
MAAIGKRVPLEGIVGNKPWRQDHGPHADLVNFGFLFKVDRIGWAKFLARPAPPRFEKIDAVPGINHILLRDGLGVRKIGSLSLAQAGIVKISNTFGALFRTGTTGNALVYVNVTGGLNDRRLKVTRLPGQTLHFSQGQELDVGMPADLDQFRRDDSHGALVGGEGLVELGHDPTNGR